MNKENIWALWPDDVMCPLDDVSEFTHKSDDYTLVLVTKYDEYGFPLEWNMK